MLQAIQIFSQALLPAVVVLIALYAACKKVPVYESFVVGAKEGLPTVIAIIPHLVGMMAAVAVFRDTGALQFYLKILNPIVSWLHIPSELLPVGLLRPITGMGSLAFVENIMQTHGPDSFLGRAAATIQASTDTTLYIATVYFGSVGIRRSLYAVKVGLWADLVGFLAAIIICSHFF